MSDYFVFDGVDSRSFGAYIFRRNSFDSAAKQVNTAAIPGRSGDVVLDGYRFGNVDLEYDVIIPDDFEHNFRALRAFLLSRNGYCRLEDTFSPTEFYSAHYAAQLSPRVTRNANKGRFTLTFSRMPQRWLKSGENPIAIARPADSDVTKIIANTGYFGSYPLFKIHLPTMVDGYSVTIKLGHKSNEYTYEFNIPDTVSADVENKDSYLDLETLLFLGADGKAHNSECTTTITRSRDDESVKLMPGENYIRVIKGGCGATIDLYPRWFTI